MDKKYRILLTIWALIAAHILPSCLDDSDETILLEGKTSKIVNKDTTTVIIEPDERMYNSVPEETVSKLQEYMPVYGGNTPPNIDGVFIAEPWTLVYTSDQQFEPGELFAENVMKFSNQNPSDNTIDYYCWQGGGTYVGKGAGISGSGDNFTVYFDVYGSSPSQFDNYIIKNRVALVISGTITAEGIKDIYYAFTMVSKENDTYGEIMDVGEFRIFHDADRLSEYFYTFTDDMYVDLGLPSGRLWANCNLGADKPWEFGSYFSWGETEVKSSYSIDNYKYFTDQKPNKYCFTEELGYNGYVDSCDVLRYADNVVYKIFGGYWTIPSLDDWQELLDNCTLEWTTNYQGTAVSGTIVRSKTYTDRHLFFPAAGYVQDEEKINVASFGYYWSSNLYIEDPLQACLYGFSSETLSESYVSLRSSGLTIRPVW